MKLKSHAFASKQKQEYKNKQLAKENPLLRDMRLVKYL